MKTVDELCISSCEIINAVILYCLICLLFSVVVDIFKICVYIICNLLENIITKIDKIIMGGYNEKSLKYGFITLWFLKFEADTEYFIDWIRYDIVKTYTVISSIDIEDRTILYWAKKFSIDRFFRLICKIRKYFFSATFKHFLIIILVLFYMCRQKIEHLATNFWFSINLPKFNSGNILEMIELITILIAAFYIILDIKYKVSASFSLREERFKSLVLLEEKLLGIIQEMLYSLEKNIEVLCAKKSIILSKGATELSGKQCYLDKNNIELCEEKEYWMDNFSSRDIFEDFDDLQKEFTQLRELNEEFKESSLNFSNIYLVDYKTMLTRVGEFWNIWSSDEEYEKMKFIGKNSMQRWYHNFFMKRVHEFDGEKSYYSDEQTIQALYDASSMLDYDLKRAFILKLYLRRYERKMTKRLKKIHKFSRLHI